ncbi:MAG: ATP-binding protein [Thermoplasmata archaeon]|nr:ATP-binding protein [Thermoplasmata archaeon]
MLDNFKSFGHLDLDLTGSKDSPHDYVAIFGRNGSGKTNLIQAFQFLLDSTKTLSYANRKKDHFMGSLRLDEGFDDYSQRTMELFSKAARILDERSMEEIISMGTSRLVDESRMLGAQGNMRLEFTFLLNGADATYTMEFGNRERIIHEKLDYLMGKRRGNLFTVSREEDGRISTKFHKSFFREKEGERSLKEDLANDWGTHTLLSIIRCDRERMERELCPEIVNIMGYLDDVRICLRGRRGITFDLESGVIGSERKKELEGYESAISKFFCRVYPDIRNVHYEMDEDGDIIRYQLYFEKRVNGEFQDVKSSYESLGTRNLLRLLPYFMEHSRGKTVLIDEIDTGIHVELMYLILEDILEFGTGQLVMTTHNTRLLLKLDPKKAYVINQHYKDVKKIVPISSLARTQKNNNNEERYLNGVFGDIPHITLIDMEEIAGTFDEYVGDP